MLVNRVRINNNFNIFVDLAMQVMPQSTGVRRVWSGNDTTEYIRSTDITRGCLRRLPHHPKKPGLDLPLPLPLPSEVHSETPTISSADLLDQNGRRLAETSTYGVPVLGWSTPCRVPIRAWQAVDRQQIKAMVGPRCDNHSRHYYDTGARSSG